MRTVACCMLVLFYAETQAQHKDTTKVKPDSVAAQFARRDTIQYSTRQLQTVIRSLMVEREKLAQDCASRDAQLLGSINTLNAMLNDSTNRKKP